METLFMMERNGFNTINITKTDGQL